jgi:hypothetical protein
LKTNKNLWKFSYFWRAEKMWPAIFREMKNE